MPSDMSHPPQPRRSLPALLTIISLMKTTSKRGAHVDALGQLRLDLLVLLQRHQEGARRQLLREGAVLQAPRPAAHTEGCNLGKVSVLRNSEGTHILAAL